MRIIHVTAAIIVRNRKVFLARRRPGIRYAGKWEFPGGKLESGETPEACLVRELAEEFAIRVTVGAFLSEGRHRHADAEVHLAGYFVNWDGGAMRPVDHDRCHWVAPADLKNYDMLPADRHLARRLASHPLPPPHAGLTPVCR